MDILALLVLINFRSKNRVSIILPKTTRLKETLGELLGDLYGIKKSLQNSIQEKQLANKTNSRNVKRYQSVHNGFEGRPY